MGRQDRENILYLNKNKIMWKYNGIGGWWEMESAPEIVVDRELGYWHIYDQGNVSKSYSSCFDAMDEVK